MTNKVIQHELICSRLNDIYRNKNNNYSFANVRKAVGPNAIMVRLYDEVERLNTLLGGTKQKVKDESIEDSLMELANYCIMELVERQVDKEALTQQCSEAINDASGKTDKISINKLDKESVQGLSFPLISLIERRFGPVPGTCMFDKVAWVRNNIKAVVIEGCDVDIKSIIEEHNA